MINISKLKINCTSIAALISSSQGNTPPTEKQWKDFFNTINKPVEKLTNKQMFDIKNIVMKQVDYNPDDLSETVTKEMCEIYAQEIYGKYTLSGGGLKPHALDKGNLAEDSAIDFLSKTDGVKYTKNEKVISNPYFKVSQKPPQLSLLQSQRHKKTQTLFGIWVFKFEFLNSYASKGITETNDLSSPFF